MRELNRKPVWDIAGTLDERATATDIKDRDVIHSVNWRPHKDGKSREKRPGYTLGDTTDPPIVQIHTYTDHNDEDREVVVTQHKIKMKKNVYGYDQVHEDDVTIYSNYFAFCEFEGKLTVVDQIAGYEIRILQSDDGTTWTPVTGSETTGYGAIYQSPLDIIEFNGHLWVTNYQSYTDDVWEWDGSSWTTHDVIGTNYQTCGFMIFDGCLWVWSFVTPSADNRWKIHYYNGASWTTITDYDGAGYIDSHQNSSALSMHHRHGRLIVYNNVLYFLCTVYNTTATKLTWQVWKFDAYTYSKFTKIYDSHDDGFYYALSAIRHHDGLFHLVGMDTAEFNTGWTISGNTCKSFTSSDLINWAAKSEQELGYAFGDYVFDGKLFMNTLWYDVGTNDYTHIWYWDKAKQLWIQEGSLLSLTNNTMCGEMISYYGNLYIGKYREIYKRVVSTNEWVDVYYTEDEIEDPPAKVVWDDHLIVSGADGNLYIEGDEVYSLGTEAPETAPTAATGAAGNLTGAYQYVVTFYRSGNYPTESNPSPESNTVSPASEQVDLTGIPISYDPKINARRIYRTKAAGAIFYWLDDILDNTTTIYTDDYTDDELGDEVSYDRLPPPGGKYFEVWDNRLWIAGNDEYPNLLFFTNLGTAEEWGSQNFLNIARRESDVIMQIKAFGDSLYVFKRRSMFKIEKVGESLYQQTELPQNIGTDSSYSVAVCDTFMIWKSEYGIEVYNGIRCFRPMVSEVIQYTMDTINPEALNRVIGGHNMVDGEYWLSIPTEDNENPNKTIVFDYLRNTFTIYEFHDNLNAFYNDKDYYEGLRMLIGTEDGNIFIWSGGATTDGGEYIDALFSTKWFSVSGIDELWNILRKMYIRYILPADKTITMRIYANYREEPEVEIPLTGSTASDTDQRFRREILKKINLRVPGNYIRFEFQNAEDTEGECRIMGFDTWYRKALPKNTLMGD